MATKRTRNVEQPRVVRVTLRLDIDRHLALTTAARTPLAIARDIRQTINSLYLGVKASVRLPSDSER